ncbi:hypothetical protein TNCV_174141 [Trichonephila clavipes]|nr:hypothetical protein TNCV_174141 [Trichonephila clavipes]
MRISLEIGFLSTDRSWCFVWKMVATCRIYKKTCPNGKWLATLTAMPQGLSSNPGEDMDVCKCIGPLRHGGILNSRRAVSPFVWLVGGLCPPSGFSSSKLGWNRAKSFCHLHDAQS